MYSISKKAIAGHIIVLFIVSLVMSVFLIFITEGFYGNDHIDCKKIEYEITSNCKDSSLIKLDIDSHSPIKFEIVINGDRNPTENTIEANGEKEIRYSTKDKTLSVVPAIKDNGIFMCTGKTKKINTEVLIKC